MSVIISITDALVIFTHRVSYGKYNITLTASQNITFRITLLKFIANNIKPNKTNSPNK